MLFDFIHILSYFNIVSETTELLMLAVLDRLFLSLGPADIDLGIASMSRNIRGMSRIIIARTANTT